MGKTARGVKSKERGLWFAAFVFRHPEFKCSFSASKLYSLHCKQN